MPARNKRDRLMALDRLVSARDEKGSIFSRPISTLRDSTEIFGDDILYQSATKTSC
jgi:hypothetical protein